MARLLSPPAGLRYYPIDKLTGPSAVKPGKASLEAFVQTRSSPFGVVVTTFKTAPIRGKMLRRFSGWIDNLRSGENATRITYCDINGLNWEDAGLASAPESLPWSNGKNWSNGKPWHGGLPLVSVAANTAYDDNIIELGPEFWGQKLGMGDWIGFAPFHLAAYEVREAITPTRLRVWPPLRKAIANGDLATLHPTLAMRLADAGAVSLANESRVPKSYTFTMIEVRDYDVREFYTG